MSTREDLNASAPAPSCGRHSWRQERPQSTGLRLRRGGFPPGHGAAGREIRKTEITGDIISAPVVAGDRIYFTCFDGTSFCAGAGDGEVTWKEEEREHERAVEQQSGAVAFLYDTGHPMVFQPALAGGNLYAGTATGLLICLKTGDKDVDGWHAWGGNAQHNKSYEAPAPDTK